MFPIGNYRAVVYPHKDLYDDFEYVDRVSHVLTDDDFKNLSFDELCEKLHSDPRITNQTKNKLTSFQSSMKQGKLYKAGQNIKTVNEIIVECKDYYYVDEDFASKHPTLLLDIHK